PQLPWGRLTEVYVYCTFLLIIHSLIFYTAYSIVGHGGAGAYLQQSTGESQGAPWTGHQSIADQSFFKVLISKPCLSVFLPYKYDSDVIQKLLLAINWTWTHIYLATK
ncbi:hypothetical protein ILYODFUR_005740, partial [Ilyodon furcidens]